MKRLTLWTFVGFSLLIINILMKEYIGDIYEQATDALLIMMLADRFADWILRDRRKEDEHD